MPTGDTHTPDAHAVAAFVLLQTLMAQLEAMGSLPVDGRKLVMERALSGLETIPPSQDLPSELLARSRRLLEAWL